MRKTPDSLALTSALLAAGIATAIAFRGCWSPAADSSARTSAPPADARTPTTAPDDSDLPLVASLRTLAAAAIAEDQPWTVEGLATPWHAAPGASVRIRWLPRGNLVAAPDLVAAIDEAGRFRLTADRASWQPLESYGYEIRTAELLVDSGWCTLDRHLRLDVAQPLVLAGRIVGPDDAAAAFDFVIDAHYPSKVRHRLANGRTDDDGRFRVTAHGRARIDGLYVHARDRADGTLYVLPADREELLAGTAVLRCRRTTIRVRVFDETGAAANDATVQAVCQLGGAQALTLLPRPASTPGLFELTTSPHGEVTVFASAPKRRPAAATVDLEQHAGAAVDLPPLVLVRSGAVTTLHGSAQHADGRPAPSTSILRLPSGLPLEAGHEIERCLTDEHGRFELPAQTGATYTLIAQHPEHVGFWTTIADASADRSHRLELPALTTLRIRPIASSTFGAVAWPLPIVYVLAHDAGDSAPDRHHHGHLWSLDQRIALPTAAATLCVTTPAMDHFGIARIPPTGGPIDVSVAMTPTRRLRGLVLGKNGAPAAATFVRLDAASIPTPCIDRWHSTRTDANGAFELVVPSLAETRLSAEGRDGRTTLVLGPHGGDPNSDDPLVLRF
jgi:hypothetical protein